MLNTLDLRCSLRFYGGVRKSIQDFVTYAYCKDVEHDNYYRFVISNNINNPITSIDISSSSKDFDSFIHKLSDVKILNRFVDHDEMN